jgi:hypothetical protein
VTGTFSEPGLVFLILDVIPERRRPVEGLEAHHQLVARRAFHVAAAHRPLIEPQ